MSLFLSTKGSINLINVNVKNYGIYYWKLIIVTQLTKEKFQKADFLF